MVEGGRYKGWRQGSTDGARPPPATMSEGVVGERAPAVETTGERSGQLQVARFENVPGLRVREPLLTRHICQR